MARRRKTSRHGFLEPSMVPLADMLTNTVGILVFILIFTVLTAGGAVVVKNLPVEHEVAVNSTEYFICVNHKVYALRRSLVDRLTAPANNSEPTPEGRRKLAALLNNRTESDDQLTLRMKATVEELGTQVFLEVEVTIEPSPDSGDAPGTVTRREGAFESELARLDPKSVGLRFWVLPDSIAAFHAARDRASDAGFASNWSPRDPAEPLTFRFGGGGKSVWQSGR